jgi:hypothetical protein
MRGAYAAPIFKNLVAANGRAKFSASSAVKMDLSWRFGNLRGD